MNCTCINFSVCFLDINECARDTDDCDSNALCANNPGSFTCTCDYGFRGDGKSCTGMFKIN